MNDVNVANVSNGIFNATGLAPNTAYTLRINTMDIYGNINFTNITGSKMTFSADTTPPSADTTPSADKNPKK